MRHLIPTLFVAFISYAPCALAQPAAEPATLPEFVVEHQMSVCQQAGNTEACNQRAALTPDQITRSNLTLSGMWRQLATPGYAVVRIRVTYTRHASGAYTARVLAEHGDHTAAAPLEATMPDMIIALQTAINRAIGVEPPHRLIPRVRPHR